MFRTVYDHMVKWTLFENRLPNILYAKYSLTTVQYVWSYIIIKWKMEDVRVDHNNSHVWHNKRDDCILKLSVA